MFNRWASNDARFGPRQVTLIDTRRDPATLEDVVGVYRLLRSDALHRMMDEALHIFSMNEEHNETE